MAEDSILSTEYRVQYKVGAKQSNWIEDSSSNSYMDTRDRLNSLHKAPAVIAVRSLLVVTTVYKEVWK